MAKQQIASRVDDTTKREVEEYAAEHDITQSEAIRVLLARGIDYELDRLKSPERGGEDEQADKGAAAAGEDDPGLGTRLVDLTFRATVVAIFFFGTLLTASGAAQLGLLGLPWSAAVAQFAALTAVAAVVGVVAAVAGLLWTVAEADGGADGVGTFLARLVERASRNRGVR